MTAVAAAELAHRVRQTIGLRQESSTADSFLRDWERTGVAERVFPGRWRLTRSGRAMFSAYVSTST